MSRRSLFRALARGALIAGLALICLFAGFLIYDSFAPPISTLMLGRKIEGKAYQRAYVRLKDIAPVAVASVIASEDARFCTNDGVDWGALHEVLTKAGKDGPSRGASTITMQTAKNFFCGPAARPCAKASRSASRSCSARSGRRRIRWRSISTSPNGAMGCSASRPPRSAISTRARADSMRARRRCWRPRCPIRSSAIPRIRKPFQRRLAANLVARAQEQRRLGRLPAALMDAWRRERRGRGFTPTRPYGTPARGCRRRECRRYRSSPSRSSNRYG